MGRSRRSCIQTDVGGYLEHRNIAQEAEAQDETVQTFSPTEVWSAVNRIRASKSMSGCHRLMQLLEFVIALTLKGDSGHLKETTIGLEVFGRPPDYDPKVDTIVRSQAWRLRAKLKKYYATDGMRDPLIIEIPTGHYIPAFHAREEAGIVGEL